MPRSNLLIFFLFNYYFFQRAGEGDGGVGMEVLLCLALL